MISSIKRGHRSFSMEAFYRTIGGSRQNTAQCLARAERYHNTESQVIDLVHRMRELHPRMGSRPLYKNIEKFDTVLPVGITKFEQIVSKNGLTVKKIKSKKVRTSDGLGKGRYVNLTNNLILSDINQLIVFDITYFHIRSNTFYLFTAKDVYSQFMLSVVPSRTMEADNAMKCIRDIVEIRGEDALRGCIHHTDNGSQYEAIRYKSELVRIGFKISRSDECKQNGSIEQSHFILKSMYLDQWSISSFSDLELKCKRFLYLNNHQRSIKQLGYMTPIEFENRIKTLPKSKRPKKQLHDFAKKDKGF